MTGVCFSHQSVWDRLPSCNQQNLGSFTKKGVIKKYIKVFKRDRKLAWVAMQPGTLSKTYDSIVATTTCCSLYWAHTLQLEPLIWTLNAALCPS